MNAADFYINDGQTVLYNEGVLGRYMNGVPLPALLTSHFVQKLTNHYTGDWWLVSHTMHEKRRCEITIISFSRSICRGELAALIGVTGKPYPRCLSCHSHPIRPCGAPSLSGDGCDTIIPSSKKRRRSRHESPEPWTLNPEPWTLNPKPWTLNQMKAK